MPFQIWSHIPKFQIRKRSREQEVCEHDSLTDMNLGEGLGQGQCLSDIACYSSAADLACGHLGLLLSFFPTSAHTPESQGHNGPAGMWQGTCQAGERPKVFLLLKGLEFIVPEGSSWDEGVAAWRSRAGTGERSQGTNSCCPWPLGCSHYASRAQGLLLTAPLSLSPPCWYQIPESSH